MNHLSNRAVKGLVKVGNVLCPENGEFPKYETVAATNQLDNLVQYAPESDINDLGMVLAIFSFMPMFIIKWIVNLCTNSMTNPSDGVIMATLRQLNMGLRGLVFSTYYSELAKPTQGNTKNPLDIIDFKLNRVLD